MRSGPERARNVRDIAEALAATIAVTARERDFFRRSGAASAQDELKALLLEIAEELDRSHARLEAVMERLARLGNG